MQNNDISLNVLDDILNLKNDQENEIIKECKFSQHDIAVVGISVRAGGANNAEELWNAIHNGDDMITDISLKRSNDAEMFAKFLGRRFGKYAKRSYLDQIDMFSPSFFNIPPKDAALIDPAQRMMLETAWKALEDAGETGSYLDESRTGVFIGYTAPDYNYSKILSEAEPEFSDRAISGRVNSMIASRISYYLNLKGPAIMVDTACSSSLVAVHLACQSIRSGECNMAVVGSVKYVLLPDNEEEGEITVESVSGRTRTFNVDSDGTGSGEGVAAIVLKPLRQAQEDKNHIYAVIKGSAINQDGTSVGITAPNAASQEDVIAEAWKDADIDPECISYIEAHGTATKLGDPVEVSGIERAFSRYTNKKQFCAIGSIKTNLGHLDCAAGIVGLIKCLLALKYKEIPPMLHFYSPNKEINFIDSPVYINDSLTSWKSGGERICGISSFGMSGTNCHVILQEYAEKGGITDERAMILPVSARNEKDLQKVVQLLKRDVSENRELLRNIIYTYAISKSSMKYRYAVVIKDYSDIENIVATVSVSSENNSHRTDKLVDKIKESDFTDFSSMSELCELYMNGADVDWRELYSDMNTVIVPVSGYPMKMERCWAYPEVNEEQSFIKKISHPLIDRCVVSSPQISIYSVVISELTHSEVREHIIGEKNVLAGTVYVEMIHCAASDMLETKQIQIDDLVFMLPMIFEKEQKREVQVVLYREDPLSYLVNVQSRAIDSDEWTTHIQAKVSALNEEKMYNVNYNEIYNRIIEVQHENRPTQVEKMVTTGPRWSPEGEGWLGDGEMLARTELKEEYAEEQREYYIYPAILDASVNCSSAFNSEIFCLPFYYGKLRIYKPMPRILYSHVVKKLKSTSPDSGINTFDIVMFDESGEIVATVDEYAMKKVDAEQQQRFFKPKDSFLHTIEWKEDKSVFHKTLLNNDHSSVIVIKYIDNFDKAIYNNIKSNVINDMYELVFCDWEAKNTSHVFYSTPDDKEKVISFFNRMEDMEVSKVIFLFPLNIDINDFENLHNCIDSVLHGFWNITYALASNKKFDNVVVDIVAPAHMEGISPVINALSGMGKSLLFEYSRLKFRSVVYSEDTPAQTVTDEISNNNSNYMTYLKKGSRYIPQLVETEITSDSSFEVVKGGTYLITGGTKGIGLVIAKKLAELESDINLVLVSRSGISFESERHEEQDGDLGELRNKVSSLKIVKCDINSSDAVKNIMAELDGLTGIIHSAGLAGGGFVIKSEWQKFNDVIKPKIYGTWNLLEIAKKKNPDFITLFSSYSTILAVPGQSDYIAANSFIDALAYYENNDKKIKVINWSGWSETGMALRNGVDMSNSSVESINNEEGGRLFIQAMSADSPQVLVGRLNANALADIIDDVRKLIKLDSRTSERIKSIMLSGKKRITANTTYNIVVSGKGSPLTETETKIAQAWAKELGLSEVNYYDKFMEIGGDSMSATYLQKEINIAFPNTMDITDVFIYSSIPDMAKFIDDKIKKPIAKQQTNKGNTDQMKALLEKLAINKINVSDVENII